MDSLSGSVGVGLLVYLTLQQKDKGATVKEAADGTVFISHADAEEDARLLQKMLAEKFGARIKLVCDVGCVIGAHSGPGTLAIFFIGKKR